MLELKDGFVLYHGSYCEVKEPDLFRCAKRKDFGQGFYLNSRAKIPFALADGMDSTKNY